MKIFKHRGDIYISKSESKKSREEHILLICLAVIVSFTVVFFAILSQKYSSVKDFFAGDSVSVTQNVNVEQELPQISGKVNYLIIETDDEESTIHFAFLIQADADSLSYKVCTLSPKTDIDGQSLYDLYSLGGGATIQTKLTSYLGVSIDYYATMTTSDFIEVVNKLGSFIYPSPYAVKFNYDKNESDKYSVRINKGEQKISGSELSDLLRYYSNDDVNHAESNQIILYGLTQLFNEENFGNAEAIFRLFINSSTTNITVRNFQDGMKSLEVFCKKNNDIAVYSAKAEYDEKNVLTPNSVSEIKGYFSK